MSRSWFKSLLHRTTSNGVRFYPIIVNKEGFSWKRLKEEASQKLFAGEFDDAYQAQLINEFEEALGI